MAIPLRLKVFKGDELVATRDYERDMIKIGRLSTAHLCLDDEKASRIHAVLNVEGDGRVSIVDMGSVEGTYLNGKRVNKGIVQFGDEIRIGSTRILVGDGSQPAEQTTVVASISEPAAAVAAEAAAAAVPPPPPAEVAAPPPPPPAAAESFAAQAPVAEQQWPEEEAYGGAIEEGRHRGFHFAEKTFNTYVAAPPQPRHPRPGSGKLGLQVRYFWGDQLLQVTQHATPEDVWIGASSRSEFRLDAERLGSQEFALVTGANGTFTLNVSEGMRGGLDRGGESKPLGAGAYELKAPDFAWVEFAGVRAELSFDPQPKRVVVPLSQSIDYRFINMFLLLAFLIGVFVVSASTHTEVDIVADDLSSTKLNVAKFLIKEAERPKKNPLLDKLKEIKEPQPGEMAERHKGKEGQMGKKDAPVDRKNRSAPKAIDINAKDLVKRTGLVNVLGGSAGGGGLATIFGQGGLGGDIKGALGNMFGSRVGDSGGFGGLGLKGTGTGGGGMGNTIGIGGIGTKGRGGGLGSYGVGVGSLGSKKSTDVAISDSESMVQGSLDKELIRQVIRRNIGQIRYCYEKELQTKPNLAGKVAVRFIIAPNGDVSTAKVAENSTINDAALGECITVRVRSWKFPQTKGGGSVIVTYPFVFKQSGD